MTDKKQDTSPESFLERWYVLPKLLYFTMSYALYSSSGTLSNMMKTHWKFSNSEVAFLSAVQGINFIGAMVWTGFADRTGKHKQILAGATLAYAFFLTLTAFPLIVPISFLPHGSRSSLLFTLLSNTTAYFFNSAMFPLIDTSIIGMLSKNPRFTKDNFGYQRLFGGPGHLVGFIVGAWLQDIDLRLYLLNFVLASCTFAALVMITIPAKVDGIPKSFAHHGHKDKDKPNHLSQATSLPMAPSPVVPAVGEIDVNPIKPKERSPFAQLVTNIEFMFFMLFVLSAGLLANTMTTLLTLKLTQRKEKTTLLKAALTRIPATVSEIIIYLSSKPVTAAIGNYWLLLFSQTAGIIRLFVNSGEQSYYVIALVESLKGINSGFIVSGGVRIASDMAPPGCSTTAQGLFSGVYKGLSFMLTGIVSGLILHFTGQDIGIVFTVMASIASITTLCFFIKFLFFDRTIGLPGFPRKEKTPIMAHDATSTSSFGSTASSDAVPVHRSSKA